jgi:hypothetical protein
MAKAATTFKVPEVDKGLLAQIVSGNVKFVSQAQGQPMLSHNPPLIEVNTSMTNPADPSQAACRPTAAAGAYLSNGHSPSAYPILSGVVLPDAKKRGNSSGSGAPTKYPFADMDVGAVFFSADSEHKKGDAVKALGSTVSSQNRKYAVETGESKTVTRAIRDKKTHKAILNADGTKQTETVTLPVLSYERKFTIRPVVGGQTYGNWTAPANGALVARTK